MEGVDVPFGLSETIDELKHDVMELEGKLADSQFIEYELRCEISDTHRTACKCEHCVFVENFEE